MSENLEIIVAVSLLLMFAETSEDTFCQSVELFSLILRRETRISDTLTQRMTLNIFLARTVFSLAICTKF